MIIEMSVMQAGAQLAQSHLLVPSRQTPSLSFTKEEGSFCIGHMDGVIIGLFSCMA